MKKRNIVLAGLAAALLISCVGCQSSFGLGELTNLSEELQKEMEAEAQRLKEEAAASSSTPASAPQSFSSSSSASSSSQQSVSSSSSVSPSSQRPASSSSSATTSSQRPASSSTAGSAAGTTATEISKYILPNSDSQYISAKQLKGMTDYQLMMARNEIYARHGRRFVDTTIQLYFNQQSWYRGTVEPEDFSDQVFNQYERANLNAIVAEETSRK